MRKDILSVVGITLVALGGIAATFVAGNEPLLGIDLQGGVSVVLEPEGEATDQQLDDAIEIIRSRVDSFGVAEPDIVRNGSTIEVALPGTTEDQRAAIALVEQTAELQFRPVLAAAPTAGNELIPPDTTAEGTSSSSAPADTTPDGGDSTTSVAEAAPTTSTPDALGQAPTTTLTAPEPRAQGTTPATAAPAGPDLSATSPQNQQPPAPNAEPVADETAVLGSASRCLDEFEARESEEPLLSEGGVAPTRQNGASILKKSRLCDVVSILDEDPQFGSTLKTLGPTGFTGVKLSEAAASFDANQVQWVINVSFTGGADPHDGTLAPGGGELFDEMASTCVAAPPECPTNQLAFVLDGEILSDPTFQTTEFGGSAVISGDFSEEEAKEIAIALRYGALPVSFENQGVQTVSSSIGEDALEAGIIAGVVAFVLVSVFIIGYYRYLGLVAIASLVLSVSMLWTMIAWLGSSRGLALTIAGITGIIVSFGISLDSNVVYFETLKEDVRDGRTPRSSVDRAFPVAFSTIVKADVASLISAALLYWLTTGAVRGFALYLGVATLLDLVATYFFLGPAVRLLARRQSFADHPSRYGIPLSAPASGADR